MVYGISLFSGPGGSSTGLKEAGVENVVGVEWDDAAVTTARAAGHSVIHQDVRLLSPRLVAMEWFDWPTATGLLLQASPPCQGLSMAGKGKGREDVMALLNAVAALSPETGFVTTWDEARDAIPALLEALTEDASDERSPLTFEVLRWIFDLAPEYIMLEQVPAALPIWEAIAAVLRAYGYAVWTGNVQAEQFGVPQTRKRAILCASIYAEEMSAPVPTHSKYHNRSPERLDEGVLPWVSMAEALGWGVHELVGFPRKYDGRGEAIEIDGELYRGRDLREASNPSFVVTEKARSWNRYPEAIVAAGLTGQGTPRDVEAPAPTMTAAGNAYWLMDPKNYGSYKKATHMGDVRNKNGCVRPLDAPAPTITASMDNGNFQFVDRSPEDRPFDAADEEIVYVNGTHEKAARRTADQPAPTVMFGARLNKVEWQLDRDAVVAEVEPRVNNQSGTEFDLAWPADRPAPTIAGRDIVTMPGANANRYNGSTKSRNDGIRVTVEEAGILQSFPADYPWSGTKTKQHEQVGNAVPPLLQKALTLHTLGN